jgi:hypothetical protein
MTQRSLWVACLAMAPIQLAGRIWPLEHLWLWTLSPLAAWLLVVVGVSLLRPLHPMRVARRVDAELGLKERLATALQLEGGINQPTNHPTFQPDLIAQQRQDALLTAQAIDSHCAFPLLWLRRSLILAMLFVVVALVMALLPNPMDAVLAERAAVAEAVEEQAKRIETLGEEIEKAQELTPEEREELLRQLAELAEQLHANPGDREEALADLSQVEETLRQKLDPNADARRANLEALAAQLQTLTGSERGEEVELSDAAEVLEKLVQELAEMDGAERQALAQALAQTAAQAAQSGDTDLAQALAALAQAAQSGDGDAAAKAAQAAADALAQAQGEMAHQAALQGALSQLQESRRAIAQAGQGSGQGQAAVQGQGQGQPGSAGGTQADALPPAQRPGKAGRPQDEGRPAVTGELDQQIYVPWERRQGNGEEITITSVDTGQGEAQVREHEEPLPGALGQALVPYHEVYYDYLDAANQAMERNYIPPGLEDFVREYFSQLEP